MTTKYPWRWYYGLGTSADCEHYFAAESRDAAVAAARAASRPGDAYCVGEALPTEPNFAIFDAGEVIERFGEENDDCWGEDGPDFSTTPEQDRDLEARLARAFREWADDHGRPWHVLTLRHWRNVEDLRA